MILRGKIIKDARIIKETFVEKDDPELSYRDLLEFCLLSLCKQLEVTVPLWLRKNTTDFVRYRKTFFTQDQFVDKINFDRFEIKVE